MKNMTATLPWSLVYVIFIILERTHIFCDSFRMNSYSFDYSVQSLSQNLVSRHWEERKGNFVQGEYSFLSPNGKVQYVKYNVDGQRGFRAFVSYRDPGGEQLRKGHLKFPDYYRKPINFAQPVGLITRDLLLGTKTL